jgi:hypothetical protein
MPQGSLPVRDRAGLSSKARDHLHELTTPFTKIDLLSLAVDLLISFLLLVILCLLCSMTAFGLLRPGVCVPRELLGPEKYEMFWWLIFSATAVLGLWGLLQFWLRRIWVQTYGSRKQVWTGGHAFLILLGAVMPGGCLLMLSRAGHLMTWQGAAFAAMAILYIRHAFRVVRWSAR